MIYAVNKQVILDERTDVLECIHDAVVQYVRSTELPADLVTRLEVFCNNIDAEIQHHTEEDWLNT